MVFEPCLLRSRRGSGMFRKLHQGVQLVEFDIMDENDERLGLGPWARARVLAWDNPDDIGVDNGKVKRPESERNVSHRVWSWC